MKGGEGGTLILMKKLQCACIWITDSGRKISELSLHCLNVDLSPG